MASRILLRTSWIAIPFPHKSLDAPDEPLQEGGFAGCEGKVYIDVGGTNVGDV